MLPDAEMGEPLDTNKELNTVGWSNIISGLTGGFTGRYYRGRTILTPQLCQERASGVPVEYTLNPRGHVSAAHLDKE